MDVGGYLRRKVISSTVVPHVISIFKPLNLSKNSNLSEEHVISILSVFNDLLRQLEKGRSEFQAACNSLCFVEVAENKSVPISFSDLPLLLDLEDSAAKQRFDETVFEFLKVSLELHERNYSEQSLVFDPQCESNLDSNRLLLASSNLNSICDGLRRAGLYEAIVNDKLENVVRYIVERRVSHACQNCVKECNTKSVRKWIDTVVSDWLQSNGLRKRTELRLVANRLYVAALTCLVRERTTRIYEIATRFERARNAIREFGDSIAQLEAFAERDAATSREADTEQFAEEDEFDVLCFLRETYSRLTDALLRGVREHLLNASRTTHEVLAVHVAIVRLLTAIDRAVDEHCAEAQQAVEEGGTRSQRNGSETHRNAPRFVDTIGQWVAEPIRLYLRMRTDAIRCVIRALRNADATTSQTGTIGFGPQDRSVAHRVETDKEKENRQPAQSESESETDEGDGSDDDVQHISELETDSGAPISGAWLNWQPRRVRFEAVAYAYRPASGADEPLDDEPDNPRPRHPILSKRHHPGAENTARKRRRDARMHQKGERDNEAARIIGSLVALFGTDEHFVNEYRNVLADSLLAGRASSTQIEKPLTHNETADAINKSSNVKEKEDALQRERRAIRFLKRRFGAAKLRECDVMLADVFESSQFRKRYCTEQDCIFYPRIKKKIEELLCSGNEQQAEIDAKAFLFEPLIISGAYWPTLKEGRFVLPSDFQGVLDEFTFCYRNFRPNRSLEWRTQLGTMTIDVECESEGERRTLRLTVSTAQACLLKAFEERSEWSIEELAAQFNSPISATRNRLGLFVRYGLIRQVDTRTFRLSAEALSNNDKETRRRSVAEANRFVRADERCEFEGDEDAALNTSTDDAAINDITEEQQHGEEDEEEENGDGESAVQTNDERNEEALSTAFAYVVGMLRQLNEVTFERIATMLTVFLPHVTARCDSQALKSFLDAKVRSRELVFANGAYRLPS